MSQNPGPASYAQMAGLRNHAEAQLHGRVSRAVRKVDRTRPSPYAASPHQYFRSPPRRSLTSTRPSLMVGQPAINASRCLGVDVRRVHARESSLSPFSANFPRRRTSAPSKSIEPGVDPKAASVLPTRSNLSAAKVTSSLPGGKINGMGAGTGEFLRSSRDPDAEGCRCMR